MTTITPLPTPPSRQDPANFSNRADDFLGALPLFATEANAVAGEVNTNAATSTTQAGIATTQAGIATTQAGIATTKAGEALSSATLAEDWAIKTDAPVSGSDYSSKYYSLEAKALNEKYQGSLVSDPTLDKEGNPISAGDWYVNSSTGYIRVYNGVDWVQGIASVAGVTSVNGNSGILVSKDVVPVMASNAGKVLKVNSSATDVEWGIGVAEGYQEFTTSGIWTKPAEATWIYVEAIGGGQSGGAGCGATHGASQRGGAGGKFVSTIMRAIEVGAQETVIVGSGGVSRSVTGTYGASGAAGGASSFGSHLVAPGGAEQDNFNNFGDGYECGYQTNTSKPGGSAVMGGAAGGNCSAVATEGGTSVRGGSGGAAARSATNVATTATSGSAPGGGGGAATIAVTASGVYATSGAGGNGIVRVWWW